MPIIGQYHTITILFNAFKLTLPPLANKGVGEVAYEILNHKFYLSPRRFELLQIPHQEIILPLNYRLYFEYFLYFYIYKV